MDTNRLLDKLEPLIPSRVERWRRALPFVSEQTQSLIHKEIVATAHRMLGDVSKKLLLSLPPERTARGVFHIGTVVYDKKRWPFGLRRRELLQHLAIFGRSGAGKTNVAFHLFLQCVRHRVPVLFLDWKRTARHLLPDLRGQVSLYTPGRSLAPLVFNPFIPPPGLEPHLYINHLVDVLGAAFTLGEGAKSIIQQALAACYRTPQWPDVQDVLAQVASQQLKSRALGWKVSAERALQSLGFAGVHAGPAVSQKELVASLLKGTTIIELDGLNEAAKKFLVPILCLWIYYVKLTGRSREQLELVIFLEEAHHVLYRQEHQARETTLNTLLRQCREIGMAMVVIDQHPHLMSSVALGNTYASICLNQKDPADINRAAALCLLDEQEKKWLSRLPIGYGIVKLQDRWTRPFLVEVPLVGVQKGSVTDEVLDGWKQGSGTLSGAKRRVEAESAGKGRSRVWDTVLNEEELAFLQDVMTYPDDGVDARYRRLGMSVDKGNRMKIRLLTHGIIEEQPVRVGRTRRVLLRVSDGARRELGLARPAGERGSLVHEYWKRFYAARFKDEGYVVELEAPRRKGRVDVLARKQRESVAIEIETGQSDVVNNVRENLASGFNQTLVIATDEKALHWAAKELARARLIVPERVKLSLRDEYVRSGER